MTSACSRLREHLSAYVDGELDAADRHEVSEHVATCTGCSQVLLDLRSLGDLVRSRQAPASEPALFAGLAGGVISRTRAEEAQSWPALLRRATGDWHWAVTGLGALSAALISIVIVAAVCDVNPRRESDDSLAALLNNLQRPGGTLFILASPVGPDQAPLLMQFNGRRGTATTPVADFQPPPAGFSGPTGSDLALALSEALVRPDGHVGDLRSMSQHDRRQTEAILGEIHRLRGAPLSAWSGQRVSVHRIVFVTNAHVSGKAL